MTKTTYYETADEILENFPHHILKTQSILDVGCSLRPQEFIHSSLHILLELFSEYVDILRYRFDDEPNYIILQGMAEEALPFMTENSIDSLFFLDVIEPA